MPQVDEFTDGVTVLQASTLNTRVTAQSWVASGGIPSTSGTLTLTQPATGVINNQGGVAVHLAVAATSLVFPASRDSYVDLTGTGTYAITSVANGAGAPAVPLGAVRLYTAVSGGSAVTAVTRPGVTFPFAGSSQVAATKAVGTDHLAAAAETASNDALTPASSLTNTFHRIFFKISQLQISQGQVPSDLVEAFTLDTLSGGTLLSNMDRLRFVLAGLYGGSWTSAVAQTKHFLLSDGTNASGTINLPIGATSGGVRFMTASGGNASNPNFDHGDTTTVFNLVINGIGRWNR